VIKFQSHQSRSAELLNITQTVASSSCASSSCASCSCASCSGVATSSNISNYSVS